MSISGPVLVTGATGFIGQRLVERLLADGCKVRALVLPDESVDGVWSGDVDVVRGDITDAASVARAMASSGTVVHLAAVVGDWGAEALYQRITVDGTRYVMEAALGEGSKVVLVSSVVYYGATVRTSVCTEDLPPGKALGPYSRSKQAQERVAAEYLDRGLAVTTVRPTNVYGPGSRPWVDEAAKLLKKGEPALIGGGKLNAGLVYVDNVVDVLVRAAESEDSVGRAYNACDGSDVTWLRYFTDLAKLVGAPKPKSIPRPVATVAAYALEAIWKLTKRTTRPPITHEALNLVGSHHRVPITRAREELGYIPSVTYEEGLKRVAEYIEKQL